MHLENKRLSRAFFLIIWTTYTAVYMTKSCFSAALASIVEEGALTKSQTGFITSAFYIVYAILQVPGGLCADRFSPVKLIKIGLLGGMAANLIIFFNQNYYVMLSAWIFNGIVQFALWPSVFKIVSSQLVRSDRKPMIFLIALASSAGLLIAYLVAAFVTKWQYNFLVSAITLLAFTVIVHFSYKRVEGELVPDGRREEKGDVARESTLSTGKLFFKSGFFVLVPAIFCVSAVEQCVKTLSPTMLMESYPAVSASLGNLMGTLVIGTGIIGMVVASYLHSHCVKKELVAYLGIILLAIPFSLALCWLGIINATVITAVMCAVVFFLAPAHMFSSQFNAKFSRYGKNGTAAGIANCAMSLSIVAESYGFNLLAEKCGWIAVTIPCVVLLVVAATLTAVALGQWNRFNKGM